MNGNFFSQAKTLKEAGKYYFKGENAETYSDRENFFNLALTKFSEVEFNIGNNHYLYYNLANCYFQLGKFSWAIFYYQKALKLFPRFREAIYNLHIAEDKLQVDENISWYHWRNFFPFPISGKELYYMHVIVITLITLSSLLSSLIFFKKMRLIAIVIESLLLLYSTALSMMPHTGVILESTFLYNGKSKRYAKVVDYAIAPGKSVVIVQKKGKWFLVSYEGYEGFIPENVIGIV